MIIIIVQTHYGNQGWPLGFTLLYLMMKKTPLQDGNSIITDQNGSNSTHAFEQCPGEEKNVAWYIFIKPNESDIKQI